MRIATVLSALLLVLPAMAHTQLRSLMNENPEHPESEAEAEPRFLTTQSPLQVTDSAGLLPLEQWRSRHAASLAEPNGWLSLVALEWLKPGDTTVGSAAGNMVHLEHAPAHLATFRLTGNMVWLIAPSDGFASDVTLNQHPAMELPLSYDGENSSEIRSGSLLLIVMQRGDRFYLRVRDSAAPARTSFHGLQWFPPSPQYRITARWVPSGAAGSLAIPNVLGQVMDESTPGMAEFTLYGQTVRLFPIVEDNKSLFFIFRDATSKTSTYGAGRFLYTDLPSNGIGRPGTIVLDFNRAENPPCAYTPYATCPLPPQQNRLTIPIPAGEKRYHD